MFERPNSDSPFLGPSQRLTPTIPTRATPQQRARANANLSPAFRDTEPATPQPVAVSKEIDFSNKPYTKTAITLGLIKANDAKNQDATPVGTVRGAANVAPPGMEKTVRALKKEKGVDNPFALAWWMKGRQ